MITSTPAPDTAVHQRVDEDDRYQHRRLLERASGLLYDTDYASLAGLIVWDPAVRGRCEVVTAERCSCREWRVWRRCPHMALFVDLFERRACSRCGDVVPLRQLSNPDGTGARCIPCLWNGCD